MRIGAQSKRTTQDRSTLFRMRNIPKSSGRQDTLVLIFFVTLQIYDSEKHREQHVRAAAATRQLPAAAQHAAQRARDEDDTAAVVTLSARARLVLRGLDAARPRPEGSGSL